MQKLSQTYLLAALILLLTSLGSVSEVQAQSFFGYQTIGRSTVFFSLAWQGKPLLGVGYNHRSFGTTFSDWQAELRFPLSSMYRFDEYQVIAGMYKPLTLARTFVGFGSHVRIEGAKTESQQLTTVSLALTGIPSYVYAASLNDGAYGTIGFRATYAPVLFASVKGGDNPASQQFLPAHRIELGGHLDVHLERTLGLGLNGFTNRQFTNSSSIIPSDSSWKIEGDFYMGSTYRLGRL